MTTDNSFQLRPYWIVQINMVSLGMDNLRKGFLKPLKNIRSPKELETVIWEEGSKSKGNMGLGKGGYYEL